MHYFVSSRQDPQASAIEIAQARRQQIFDALGVDNAIVEIERNDFAPLAQRNLKTQGRVINIYRFFQGGLTARSVNDAVRHLTPVNAEEKEPYVYYYQNKKILQFHLLDNQLFYCDYFDQYNFLYQRIFFRSNAINYFEHYNNQGQLIERDFPDEFGDIIVSEKYCPNSNNETILSQVRVKYAGQNYVFNSLDEFYAFFFDCLAELDNDSVFYCDRESLILKAFTLMKVSRPRYAVIHSSLYYNNKKRLIYPVFENLGELVKQGQITGIICATKAEQKDIQEAFNITQVYALPVTYVRPVKTLSSYKPGNLIAVARTDGVKNLKAMVLSVILLHRKYRFLTLNIYGNVTDKIAAKKLAELIKKHHAENYIHYGKFSKNVDQLYQKAELNLLTSKNEGFAMALIEAQANGCACLSYDVKYGPNEIIKDGISGKLVKPNWIDFMQQLDYLLSHPDLIDFYRANAIKQAEKYSFDNAIKKWQEFLRTQNKRLAK